MSRAAWRMGFRPGDRIGLCFGLSMHAAGTPQILWFQDYPGVTMIPIGAEAGTEKILQFMQLFKVNIFAGTPSLALHLIERCPEVLKAPVADLGIRILLLGAEPGAGIPEVRRKLETEYGATVFDAGAGYGCSCDHPIYQGMHWLADDFAYYELLDPETMKTVPMENGATGIMAATSLHPEAAVWFDMRFTMMDIHQVFTDPCPCGMSGFRYKIVGRADDMLKVKGVPVYPAAIEGVIHSMPEELTGAFRIVLDEAPPRVVPPLKLKVEHTEKVREEELPRLESELLAKMHGLLKIRPAVTWLAAEHARAEPPRRRSFSRRPTNDQGFSRAALAGAARPPARKSSLRRGFRDPSLTSRAKSYRMVRTNHAAAPLPEQPCEP